MHSCQQFPPERNSVFPFRNFVPALQLHIHRFSAGGLDHAPKIEDSPIRRPRRGLRRTAIELSRVIKRIPPDLQSRGPPGRDFDSATVEMYVQNTVDCVRYYKKEESQCIERRSAAAYIIPDSALILVRRNRGESSINPIAIDSLSKISISNLITITARQTIRRYRGVASILPSCATDLFESMSTPYHSNLTRSLLPAIQASII
jgi:hypothetical protein